MMATTAPTQRGIIDKTGIIHALDKHSGLPRCAAPVISARAVDRVLPIPVDTPRTDLKTWLTCKACLRELGATE